MRLVIIFIGMLALMTYTFNTQNIVFASVGTIGDVWRSVTGNILGKE